MKPNWFPWRPDRHRARWTQTLRVIALAVLLSICPVMLNVQAVENSDVPTPQVAATPDNLLVNGGFEDGLYAPNGSPTGWTHGAYTPQAVFTWDDTKAHTGSRSVKISATVPNATRLR